jgi:hypothetical protein
VVAALVTAAAAAAIPGPAPVALARRPEWRGVVRWQDGRFAALRVRLRRAVADPEVGLVQYVGHAACAGAACPARRGRVLVDDVAQMPPRFSIDLPDTSGAFGCGGDLFFGTTVPDPAWSTIEADADVFCRPPGGQPITRIARATLLLACVRARGCRPSPRGG